MSGQLKKILRFILFFLTGAGLLWLAFRGLDLKELMVQMKKADFGWVAAGLVCAFLALFFRAYRWRMLMKPIDASPAVSNILHAINVGYLANFVFPRIGEITRCGILNRTDGLPVDKAFGTVIVERLFDLLMVVLMLILILLLKFRMVADFLADHVFIPFAGRMSSVSVLLWMVAVPVLSLIIGFLAFRIFRQQLTQIQAFRKIKGWLAGIADGIKSVRKMKHFSLFVVLNIMVFGMYFLQTYLLFFAFEATSSLGAADALFVLVVSTLALIIPVQGGIGAFHGSVSLALTVFGMTRFDGMVYATMSHTTTSLLLIFLGAVSLIFVFVNHKPKKG
ncbi:MAG: flippase-like domain-containing protein [Bacteroidales bacterium]|jgi:uncharacterized protein (TIRG00374 family)|nr:flippase-like domain-containing protein [Bacteroidales bacterium]